MLAIHNLDKGAESYFSPLKGLKSNAKSSSFDNNFSISLYFTLRKRTRFYSKSDALNIKSDALNTKNDTLPTEN